jgi:hypothetical protein
MIFFDIHSGDFLLEQLHLIFQGLDTSLILSLYLSDALTTHIDLLLFMRFLCLIADFHGFELTEKF